MWWWHGGGPWGPFGFVLFVLFWAAVVWLIVALVRQGRNPNAPRGTRRPPAMDVLEQRYARGEITREEFVERRDVLLGRHGPAEPPPTTTPPAAPGASLPPPG